MKGRNLIGQDAPAQQPVIRLPEHRGGRLHHTAVVDDKLILPVRLIGQVAVNPVNGIMFAGWGRFIDIKQKLKVPVGVDLNVGDLCASGGQPRRQIERRHRHAASALRPGNGNTDIFGVPAIGDDLGLRLRRWFPLGFRLA